MTPSEAAALLAYAAAFDNRTVSEIAARAWAEALDPRTTFADGRQIVVEHYSSSRDWIMPSDINASSARMRKSRLDSMRTPEPPESIDPDDVVTTLAWGRAYRAAIGDGHEPDVADRVANATVNVTRPQIEAAPRPVDALVDQVAKSTRLPRKAS